MSAKSANLRRLSEKHLKAIDLMAGQGLFASDVARQLNVNQQTVYAWRRDPLFRAALDERRKAAREEGIEGLRSATRCAVSFLVRAIQPDENGKLPPASTPTIKAACEILDRAGILAATDPDEGGIDVTDHGQVMALLRALPPALLVEALKKP